MILLGLGVGEVRGTPGVGVKTCGLHCNPGDYNPLILGGPAVAKPFSGCLKRLAKKVPQKASNQNTSDGEERRLGEQTGLDTPVYRPGWQRTT